MAIISESARTRRTGTATRVVSLDGTRKTLTGDGPRSYCAGIETSQRGNRHDDKRDVGLQRPDENHLGQLAPPVVPVVRPVLLPVQGHVSLGDLVADHGQRPVGRLPPVQSRHRAAPLPSQGMGARMKHWTLQPMSKATPTAPKSVIAAGRQHGPLEKTQIFGSASTPTA